MFYTLHILALYTDGTPIEQPGNKPATCSRLDPTPTKSRKYILHIHGLVRDRLPLVQATEVLAIARISFSCRKVEGVCCEAQRMGGVKGCLNLFRPQYQNHPREDVLPVCSDVSASGGD